MLLGNAIAGARTIMASSSNHIVFEPDDIPFGSFEWFVFAGVSCLLVLFAGIMSGLTLGLMSLGLVDLEILQRSGTITEKKQAAVILPVLKKQHQLLVTLLLCNACAMEALPITLDKIFHPFVAVLLSVTFVLAFGEIIPQAICSRYGLSVGANFVWLVRILMIICYPIAYPIGKACSSIRVKVLVGLSGGFALSKETTSDVLSNAQCALAPWVLYHKLLNCTFLIVLLHSLVWLQVLDAVLGHSDALFRRAQLKALVSIHSQEAGKGGELTHDETTIISGALDLTEKTAEEAMTPIESTFSLDVNSKLDWESIGKILARGHSRIPVYAGNPKNIIGLLLVKSLLTVRPETETPVSAVSIRRMPRSRLVLPFLIMNSRSRISQGPAHMPLYDILNEFQKGSSHMAAVVKVKGKTEDPQFFVDGQKFDEHKVTNGNSQITTPLLTKYDTKPDSVVVDVEKPSRPTTFKTTPVANGVTANSLQQRKLLMRPMIRVVAAAAASSVARAPSNRRLIGQKPSGVQSKQGQMTRKPMDDESQTGRSLANPGERLPSSIERS
ncbi:hypothetical protein CXB51_018915 [Gossypium anomalum]|uniref:CNNM transmembrane domain-containing protein n=1 Tax=Gossypium anomalum TaxID=47600 RepID=A0A8J6CW11_9ROSI|nr:hypothetical protein CXB51_018915 [Gossypium anomalum]